MKRKSHYTATVILNQLAYEVTYIKRGNADSSYMVVTSVMRRGREVKKFISDIGFDQIFNQLNKKK